jgi:hypothetical protein
MAVRRAPVPLPLRLLLTIAALYSAVALIYGSYRHAAAGNYDPVPLGWLAVYFLIVTIPYVLFFAVSRIAIIASARISVVVFTVLAVVYAAIVYVPSFYSLDSYYGLVYLLVPVVQVSLVGVAFVAVLLLQSQS